MYHQPEFFSLTRFLLACSCNITDQHVKSVEIAWQRIIAVKTFLSFLFFLYQRMCVYSFNYPALKNSMCSFFIVMHKSHAHLNKIWGYWRSTYHFLCCHLLDVVLCSMAVSNVTANDLTREACFCWYRMNKWKVKIKIKNRNKKKENPHRLVMVCV